MKIYACPKCGSKRILQGTIGDGVLTGYTTKDVCRDCWYQGSPIVFDSEKEYKKFQDGLSKEKDIDKKGDENGKDETLKLSKKEKEVLEFLNELKKEESQKTEYITEEEEYYKHKEKNWWIEIGLAAGISATLTLLSVPGQFMLHGFGFEVIYVILSFIPIMLFVLVVLVLMEFLHKSVKNRLRRK